MKNTKRRLVEIRDSMMDIQYQVQFMGAVMTADIALGEAEKVGAALVFEDISTQLARLSEKTAATFLVIDQGNAPS